MFISLARRFVVVLAVALALVGAAVSNAQQYVPIFQQSTITNVVGTVTNVTAGGITSYTNIIDVLNNKYHTLQVYSTATGTNYVNYKLFRTLDNTNYYLFATNQLTATGVVETNSTGTWSRFRIELTVAATNATASAWYGGSP